MNIETSGQRVARRNAAKKRNSPAREALEWVLSLALAVLIALLIHHFLGQLVVVKGNSMYPTLHNRDRVISSRITYFLHEPQIGDIAVVRYPNRRDNFIKRVVGLPGDRLKIEHGQLYRNGVAQEEPYLYESILYDMPEQEVPAGHLFVLGDNRNDSSDSHLGSIGPLRRDQVRAKAIYRIWPFARWGGLYPADTAPLPSASPAESPRSAN